MGGVDSVPHLSFAILFDHDVAHSIPLLWLSACNSNSLLDWLMKARQNLAVLLKNMMYNLRSLSMRRTRSQPLSPMSAFLAKLGPSVVSPSEMHKRIQKVRSNFARLLKQLIPGLTLEGRHSFWPSIIVLLGWNKDKDGEVFFSVLIFLSQDGYSAC